MSIWHQTPGSWQVVEVNGDLFWVGLPHHPAFQRQLSGSRNHEGPGGEAEACPFGALPFEPPTYAEYKEAYLFPPAEPLSRRWFLLDK